ncbi:MAG TPA: PepSY-associated TM helix domain-containing protein [Gemmatimonadales bacterium]|nr:PepSY-associated TM helix domain-containing protein [Gemmatimonadales bacterium]
MRPRQLLVKLHLWVGMTAAPFLLILGLTGALLVFEEPIQDAFNARLALVTPVGTAHSFADLEQRLVAAHPGYRVAAVTYPRDARHSYAIGLTPLNGTGDDLEYFVDPYTANVLGTPAEERGPMPVIHQLHTRLLAGHKGNVVVGWAAVMLVFLSLSGLVLWWPGKIFTVRWSGTAKRVTFDLHNALGAYAWVFLFLLAMTGLVIHWNELAAGPAGTGGAGAGVVFIPRPAAGGPPSLPPLPPPAPACDAARRLPFDRVVAMGAAALPGTSVVLAQEIDPTRGTAMVALRYPEDRTPAGRSRVQVDECTGAIVSTQDIRAQPARFVYARMTNRSIHTGDIFGWPTRILAALMSLTLPLMAITGPLIWWTRRAPRR